MGPRIDPDRTPWAVVRVTDPSVGHGHGDGRAAAAGGAASPAAGYVGSVGFLDVEDQAQARADERLRSEIAVWLTTVAPNGQPQATPVWFLWDGDSFLIYSQPGARKVANIRANPLVSLHLNADADGEDAVIVEATARLADDEPPSDRVPDYLEKYRDGIAGLGWTPAKFAADYSQPIRAVPTRVRAW